MGTLVGDRRIDWRIWLATLQWSGLHDLQLTVAAFGLSETVELPVEDLRSAALSAPSLFL
jgi:hypothetical protein